MKKILSYTFLILLGMSKIYAQCDDDKNLEKIRSVMDDATFLKDFKAQLPPNSPQPVRYSLLLTGNTHYRLYYYGSKGYSENSLVALYDNAKKIVDNTSSKLINGVRYFDIKIIKTGVYHIVMMGEGKSETCMVGALAFVRKLPTEPEFNIVSADFGKCNKFEMNETIDSVMNNISGETFLKSFKIYFPENDFGPNVYSLTLQKGIQYRLYFCELPENKNFGYMEMLKSKNEGSPQKMKIINQEDKKTDNGLIFYEFLCDKTDIYDFHIYSKSGNSYCGVALLTYVRDVNSEENEIK